MNLIDLPVSAREDVFLLVHGAPGDPGLPQNACLRALTQYGLDRDSTIPTDWRTYYEDEELRGFVVEAICDLKGIKD